MDLRIAPYPPTDAAVPLRRFSDIRGDFEEGILARALADRILEPRETLAPILGKVRAANEVFDDLRRLATGLGDVPAAWRLSANTAERVPEAAVALMESLDSDPRQGELMSAREGAGFLSICRRLAFDPAEVAPVDRLGRPVPRLSIVWTNLPNEGAIELTRVLAIVHRFDWRLRQPAQPGAWARRAAAGSV